MSEKRKHSPTPWKHTLSRPFLGGDDCPLILDSNGEFVLGEWWYDGPNTGCSEENLNHILRCVNAHERLVKSLQMMVEDFGKLKCDMSVKGWGARIASLQIAKDVLEELSKQEETEAE